MNKVREISKPELVQILSSNQVIYEEYNAQFKVQKLEDGTLIALHHSQNLIFLSKNREKLNESMRKHMISQGASDGYDSPITRKAKSIIKTRKALINELCTDLSITTNTDLSLEQIKLIDEKIRSKNSREIYAKYYIHLGVFLGEIIAKKTKGIWALRNTTGIFVTYQIPVVKASDGMEYYPWSKLETFYEKETGNFSLYLSISGIIDGFGVYQQDFKLN